MDATPGFPLSKLQTCWPVQPELHQTGDGERVISTVIFSRTTASNRIVYTLWALHGISLSIQGITNKITLNLRHLYPAVAK